MQTLIPDTAKVENKLKYWADLLHDMSGRNRLLFYKDTKSSTATIEKPEFTDLFEILVEKGGEILTPVPEPKESKSVFGNKKEKDDGDEDISNSPRVLKANEIQTNHSISVLNKVLYNLRYTSHTIQEEQGFNVLFITFGMLKWRETQSSEFSYAPLILVPVQVERESSLSPYKIRMAEDDIVVNPVLVTKLSKDFGVQLPDITNDLTTAQLVDFLTTVSVLIKNFDGWDVLRQTTIGVFNFLTLLLIKDFENHIALYREHSIIQILSGVTGAVIPAPDNLPQARELDDVVDPSSVFEIMDADSSQQEAIEAAKRGLSFVLQGPPGTGKSQTIANIIAEFIMAEKRVLFVSQKMAALEVVKNRLAQRGLGEFCLEVHSHKMDKRKVIDELMRSLSNTQPTIPKADYKFQQHELKQLKGELNAYIKQMHEPRFELGMSHHRIQGYLAKYFDAPQLRFSVSDLDKVSVIRLSKMTSIVREIANYKNIIETYKQNRWKGYKGLVISLQEREELILNFENTSKAIKEFCEKIFTATSVYELLPPETIQDCMDYLNIFTHFNSGIFSSSMQVAIGNYIDDYRSFTKFFNFQYWKDSSKLRSVYKRAVRPLADEVAPVLKIVQKFYNKMSRNENVIIADGNPLDEISKLDELKSKIVIGFENATGLFDQSDVPAVLKAKFDQIPSEAVGWFDNHSKNVNELIEWANFNAVKKECFENGLSDFVIKALDSKLRPERWEQTFLRRFYLLLFELTLNDRPVLQKFRGVMRSEMIQRFRSLDLLMIQNAPNEIKAKLSLNKPQLSWMQAGSAETSILRREFNKKRRIMPLRKLFYEIANLIQVLKPCLMMSPLTVSQLLEPNLYQFDLVVFDEASQIPPEYAVGAFLRAKQVIVAGDRQQLPPTNFFQVIESEEVNDDEDDTKDISFESILNAFDSSGFPSKMLNWHYRSKDESLIAYSNYHFYENRLYTFPNSSSSASTTGLKFVHVKDGVYKRGVGARHNLIEARKVAELVREHLMTTPDLSLGIVAFSVSQRKAIESEIDNLHKEHPDLNELFSYDTDEPIFIKNLENVQGDERDVIILSVGYGKDETGKMTLNFGPINRDGGARRLNVAVTRARYTLKLVTSIEPEDIDLARTNSQGAALLRNYLEVARDGVKAVYKDERLYGDAEFESPFEESVYQELLRRGVQLVPQVGVSQYRIDLAVVDPQQTGRFLLGIECDGAMYHSAFTARDRDRLRQQVLEGLGWKIYRIWSRDWIQNREAEIGKILAAIDARKQELSSVQDPISKKKRSDSKIEEQELINNNNILEKIENSNRHTAPPGAIPYRRRRLKRQFSAGGDAILVTPINKIADAFVAIVNAEGPISRNAAKHRVIEAWATRKGKRINDYLDQAISFASYHKYLVVRGDFLWPVNMTTPQLRIFVTGGDLRPILDIPPEEVVLAIRECIKVAVGITIDDLIREVGKLFGLNATEENAVHIGRIIYSLISNDALSLKNNKVAVGKNF